MDFRIYITDGVLKVNKKFTRISRQCEISHQIDKLKAAPEIVAF